MANNYQVQQIIASLMNKIISCFLSEPRAPTMSELSGKVQTVLGLIDPDQLGRTMTHEHLSMSFDCCYVPPPPGDEAVAEDPFRMEHMYWLAQNIYSSRGNLLLKETDVIRDELLAYRKAGGGAIVENTTTGLQRDLPTLRQLALDTGVHVVAGAGFYVDCSLTETTRRMTVEQVGRFEGEGGHFW